jgi:hypothetical protein
MVAGHGSRRPRRLLRNDELTPFKTGTHTIIAAGLSRRTYPMRVVIAALAVAAVAGLAVSADAAPARKKQKYSATKERVQAVRPPRGGEQFGYEASPDHYPTGSNQWWRAMEREGRGGFGDTM